MALGPQPAAEDGRWAGHGLGLRVDSTLKLQPPPLLLANDPVLLSEQSGGSGGSALGSTRNLLVCPGCLY